VPSPTAAPAASPAPGLYPKSGLPPQSVDSERKVYDALAKALPKDWYAWHSLKLRSSEGDVVEGDFVIAAPPSGILVLEIKGGRVSKRDGVWFQYDRPMRKDPLEQAMRTRKCLINRFRAWDILFPPIGEAVAFPDTLCESQPTQDNLEGLILGEREIQYLEECLPGLMTRACPKYFHAPGDDRWIAALHEMWCESWPYAMTLSSRVKAQTADRCRLDADQYKTLHSIIENDIVIIRGGAGTGKTLLARELARKEAEAGRKVLVLVFTEALAMELAKDLAVPGVRVAPVGRFALEHLREKGFKEEERYEPEFWDKITRLAGESTPLWKDRTWDTVIVDEAQDFGKYEWSIVTRCAGKNKRIWVFMDDGQAFWENRRVPPSIGKQCTNFNLGIPYRCPPGIQALADAYLGKPYDGDAIRREIEDGTIKIVVAESGTVKDEVGKEIRALIGEKFTPSDIAIISLRGMMFKGNIMHEKELGGYPVAPATDAGCVEKIVCDTFLRYKGLERPAIIVADILHSSLRFNVRMNIAVSRAFGVLRVVVTRAEFGKDQILKEFAAIII
jgi:hypothetical protein